MSATTRCIAHAHAKVNLGLEILRKRSDGYHEIETILQSIKLFDKLDIQFNEDRRIAITCTDPDIPTDEANLCYRALEIMRPLVGGDLGMDLRIDKQIPHSAGLGGGSADAAAVILAASRLAQTPIDPGRLESVALRLGTDVPFMLYGGTMLGRGRGEVLTRLEPLRGGFFLIVKPPVNISTADAYRSFRLTRKRYRYNLKQLNTLLARFPNVSLTFRNALEDVICPSYPLVSEVLEELLASTPRYASMSGSGSALFAICESETKASQLAERFSVRGFFTAVVEPSPRAVDLYPIDAR